MSQVIVTDDELRLKRQQTRTQEMRIDRDSYLNRWKKATDATKANPFAAGIGLVLMPILGFWALILFLISISMSAFVVIMRALGWLLASIRK